MLFAAAWQKVHMWSACAGYVCVHIRERALQWICKQKCSVLVWRRITVWRLGWRAIWWWIVFKKWTDWNIRSKTYYVCVCECVGIVLTSTGLIFCCSVLWCCSVDDRKGVQCVSPAPVPHHNNSSSSSSFYWLISNIQINFWNMTVWAG